jgi:hypothetical protein
MKNPEYRMATLCPEGLPDSLSNWLNSSSVDGNENSPSNREVFCYKILESFIGTRLPFFGVFIGWDTSRPNRVNDLFMALSELKVTTSDEAVSSDILTKELNKSKGKSEIITVMGAYPLLDLQIENRYQEYGEFGLTHNEVARDTIFNHSYNAIIKGLMKVTNLGVIICIMAETDQLVESKMNECISLIGNN